jgi:hypothetical protein
VLHPNLPIHRGIWRRAATSGSSVVSVRHLRFGISPVGGVAYPKDRGHDAVGSLLGSDLCGLGVEGSGKELRGWNGDSVVRCCRKGVEAEATSLWPFVDQTKPLARLAAFRCFQRLIGRTKNKGIPRLSGCDTTVVKLA